MKSSSPESQVKPSMTPRTRNGKIDKDHSYDSKNIRVFLRTRPAIPLEIQQNHTFNNLQLDPRDITTCQLSLIRDGMKQPTKSFFFNKCFGAGSRNEEIYENFGKNAVDAAFNGEHGVLFVYGQTGSGKTHTISNEDPQDYGVLQRAMQSVWKQINEDKEHDYKVTISYVQLYKEMLTNLLDSKQGGVRLQTSNDGVLLVKDTAAGIKQGEDLEAGLPCETEVGNYAETISLIKQGASRKEMAVTNMNATSSRSHTIIILSITTRTRIKRVESHADSVDLGTVATELQGKLYICDLAGSERASKTGATGKLLTEATSINGSLLVLGKVVAALTEKKAQHAPFRESKLTRILQYALMGNGNTSIIINCSPSDNNSDETHSAILFGQRAIQIKQNTKHHEVLDYKVLYLQLQADMEGNNDQLIQAAVQQEVALYEAQLRDKDEQLKYAEQQNGILKQENDQLRRKILEEEGVGEVEGTKKLPSMGEKVEKTENPSDEWRTMAEQLRGTLKAKGEEVTRVYNERAHLAIRLATEEQTVFKLAEKLRVLAIKYRAERRQYTQQVNTLQAEMSTLRGTDFLSVGALSRTMLDSPKGTILSPRDNTFSQTYSGEDVMGGQGNVFLEEQLEKTNEKIRDYRDERIALLLYQEKARKAIKMLVAENCMLGGGMLSNK